MNGAEYSVGGNGITTPVEDSVEVKSLMGVALNYRQPFVNSGKFSWYGKVGAFKVKLQRDTNQEFNTNQGVLNDKVSSSLSENEVNLGVGILYSLEEFGEAKFGFEKFGSEISSIALRWQYGFGI